MVYSRRPILWNHHGIKICSQADIPDDQEVTVGVSINEASKPSFSFPEGFTPKSHVYQIRVAATDKHLISCIQVTLKDFTQPQGRECICALRASGNPSRWEANLTPVFTFSPLEASQFKYQTRTVEIVIKWTTCYLAIASKGYPIKAL